jgi:hypothetical protein
MGFAREMVKDDETLIADSLFYIDIKGKIVARNQSKVKG